jgi:hypothetical protein
MIMELKVGDIVSDSEVLSYNGKPRYDTYKVIELRPNEYNPTLCFAVCTSSARNKGRVFYKNPKKTHRFDVKDLYYVTDASYLPEIEHIVNGYNSVLGTKVKTICE